MGDLIHTLPAVTDASKAILGITFDWVAEEGFSEIPAWHPAIETVFPVAIRRWRKNIFSPSTYREISEFVRKIKIQNYDYVIDAQGLIKSGFISRLAKGRYYGMDSNSCKEPVASLFYRNKISISKQAHAIERLRMLFASTLVYEYQNTTLDYGLSPLNFNHTYSKPYLVFLHGSSADNKLWSLRQWQSLTDIALANGYIVYLPWGNDQERTRAEKIANGFDLCRVLAKMNLTEIAGLLANASGVVGVDTGLTHMAAALSIPGVAIYLDTHPMFTGVCGNNQLCISKIPAQKPLLTMAGLETICSKEIQAEEVWRYLAGKFR